jgi:hypothetical protein
MATVACYLVSDARVYFIFDFSYVILLFSSTPTSGVWSENSGLMLPKS